MLTGSQLRTAVECAVRAPSLHNTQPWLFTAAGDDILVRADSTRWLRAEDPLGRELLISCGGAVRHLVLGLRSQGLAVNVIFLPDPVEDPEKVAVVTVTGRSAPTVSELALQAATPLRHTDRSRFSDTPLSQGLLDDLRLIAEREGCFLDVLDDEEAVELAVLTERADRLLHDEPTLRAEQALWTSDQFHPEQGVPGGTPEAHRASPVRLRDFHAESDPSDPAQEPPSAEHPTLVVLGTQTDDRLAWLRCGWALSELLLTLTGQGVVASPLTQALEITGLRTRLRTVLGLQGSPQMVLRLGYPVGGGSPQAGRRPIDEVLR